MGETMLRRSSYRSLFWPIVLIAIGVVWLMGNAGVLTSANVYALLRLWPLLLIVIGLDLLFGRQSPVIGALIGVGAVVLFVGGMLIGPSLGLAGPNLEIVTENFSEPREDATSAQVQLDLSVANATISALTDTSDLFTAEVSHVGVLDYRVEGEAQKSIYLGQQQEDGFNMTGVPEFLSRLFQAEDRDLNWNIGLSPAVPVTLNVNGGVGNSEFDLSDLQLQNLTVNGGVGNLNADLPAMEDPYNVSINSGSGEVRITLAEGAAVNLNISGGVGNSVIDVPDGAAVRVTGQSGVGNIEVPSDFRRVDGDEDNFVGSNGTWETLGYNEAERRITIQYSGGVGNLTIE